MGLLQGGFPEGGERRERCPGMRLLATCSMQKIGLGKQILDEIHP